MQDILEPSFHLILFKHFKPKTILEIVLIPLFQCNKKEIARGELLFFIIDVIIKFICIFEEDDILVFGIATIQTKENCKKNEVLRNELIKMLFQIYFTLSFSSTLVLCAKKRILEKKFNSSKRTTKNNLFLMVWFLYNSKKDRMST